MNFHVFITGVVVLGLILTLFKGWLRPSLAFLGAVLILMLAQIISIEDLLSGLANKQIILIFVLIILTAGIQRNLGPNFFYKLFKKELSPFQFRLRMMLMVSGFSSVLNNTPVVAFMIPFVKGWAESNKYSASKFLIPLSFATILGGMITVVGTSTNLVLNGLLSESSLALLEYQDFLYLGLVVAVLGILYLTIFSERTLPDRLGNKDQVITQLNEYLVETEVLTDSDLIGKSIEDAGLRHLKSLFLVELKRGEQIIPAVSSEKRIQSGDVLVFAGNTDAILNLINEKNGLYLPEEKKIGDNGFSDLTEAIVPSGSQLVGQSLKRLGFRDRFKASVISIYRKGEKVTGNLGEIIIRPGDLLLMLCRKGGIEGSPNKDLIVISKAGEIDGKISFRKILPSLISIGVLLLGIFGLIDLFVAAFLGVILMVSLKVISIQQIKASLDLDLLVVLVSALALGIAIQKSGTAAFLVSLIDSISDGLPTMVQIGLLYFLTLGLTTLITNAAAVTIMFPVAYEFGLLSGGELTPFFVAIAFAASADFMTPIGYQTNLMVMGPGNYKFSDYTKIGFPLTIIYSIVVLSFINFYYL